MARLNRKEFLGGLGCAAAGAVVGACIPLAFTPNPMVDSTPPIPPPKPKLPPPPPPNGGEESFSQCGEDVNIFFSLRILGLANSEVTYLDVGAHHPSEINNTYFFYRKGYRGVLVEPNRTYCELLRKYRPEDVTLEVGIGISDAKEADYYVLSASGLNTFSKEEAERLTTMGGSYHLEEVRKIPLMNINEVMQNHFKGAPTFISIDTEGLDLDILKTLDFNRFRPKILCVETLITNTRKSRPEIAEFMARHRYIPRGGSFVNTIFIDQDMLT